MRLESRLPGGRGNSTVGLININKNSFPMTKIKVAISDLFLSSHANLLNPPVKLLKNKHSQYPSQRLLADLEAKVIFDDNNIN